MDTSNKIRAEIAGTGMFLPGKVLTNADLEKTLDTSDEWIRTRTGICERRIADEGVIIHFCDSSRKEGS